jgi:hypothetical protein
LLGWKLDERLVPRKLTTSRAQARTRVSDTKSPLQLVSNLAQEIFAEFDVGFSFDALGFQAVDHA